MLILVTSVLIINDSKKKVMLKRVSCIYDPSQIYKEKIGTLLNSKGKINTMSPNYAWKLSFKIQKTNIKAQKIDDSTLQIFGILIIDF